MHDKALKNKTYSHDVIKYYEFAKDIQVKSSITHHSYYIITLLLIWNLRDTRRRTLCAVISLSVLLSDTFIHPTTVEEVKQQ